MTDVTKNEILELLEQLRLLAIIRQDDLRFAREMTLALAEAGIVLQEFTLTNPESLGLIRSLRQDSAFKHISIGAGSVRTLTEARQAVDAGAQFVVTPISQVELIETCVKAKVPIFPGAFTPTEIHTAWQAGAAAVKVFPATALGPGYIKDILAPMPYLKLLPTGGVNLANMAAFLANGAVAVAVGSNILDKTALESRDWQALSQHAKAYAEAARKP